MRLRCRVCGRPMGPSGCLASHVETLRTAPKHLPQPEPDDDLTPTERYSRAIHKRDELIRAQR